MNQSILFPDLQHWDENKQAVVFFAQQNGALIECFVTRQVLQELSGEALVESQHVMTVFSEWRFDLEELAEQAIEDEMFNSLGQIEITRERF
ncbi:DUF1488 domain-containing protein [Vibrio mimicus]|uniref:DUF1488 domain-containing protein n=1 Tax=Vibrio mimicus TaxID=674 RepID=UPI002FF05DBD